MLLRVFLAITALSTSALGAPNPSRGNHRPPALVVGIVIDQMRADYLHRFDPLFSDHGFRRLLRGGFLCANTQFNYQPTVTASGHASIYTGTIPAVHGIIENNFFDRTTGKIVYAVADPNSTTVGNAVPGPGASPFLLLSTTITDELKLAYRQSKVISIAIKDRSAVLPAGHFADGAFYFDASTGNWITSTWYGQQLPAWLTRWNEARHVANYLANDWQLLLPRRFYTMCTGDTVPYELPLSGESLPVFPHKLGGNQFRKLTYTPFANTMTIDLAKEAIQQEQLGTDQYTDFLCISLSAPDIIGHQFGIHSLELADCYARLDRDLAHFIEFLDRRVGSDRLLIFVTSDHGAATNPLLAQEYKLPAGTIQAHEQLQALNDYVYRQLGIKNACRAMIMQQVYLNDSVIAAHPWHYTQVVQTVADFLQQQSYVLCVVSPKASYSTCPEQLEHLLVNGYYAPRSGDILFAMKPGWIDWHSDRGTNHGTVHPYDETVPLIWYGWKIKSGSTVQSVRITDIAPTLAYWMKISAPSGSLGSILPFIPLKKR